MKNSHAKNSDAAKIIFLSFSAVMTIFALGAAIVFAIMWAGQVECHDEPPKPVWCRKVAP